MAQDPDLPQQDEVLAGLLIVLDDRQWPSAATAVRYFEVNTGWQPYPIRLVNWFMSK